MTSSLDDFLHIAETRGFLYQVTDREGLANRLKTAGAPAYIGYDATAPSLHVGSLVSIMLLRWYQKCGHQPLVLMGGGTTKVGDPSGRDSSRQLLDNHSITNNIKTIRHVFEKYLTFGNKPSDALMLNNADWLDKLNYIEFLRDYGRHFSVNRMLSFDSVRLRLDREQTLSFLEFNYMILQAYDFYELARRYGCILQMGGADQWGNIVNGIELTRRVTHDLSDKPDKETGALYGLTVPLLTTASGAKMGKTASGAIWLNADMLPAYEFWQYWRNIEDADIGKFLRLFTELPLDEVARLEALGGQEINEAKKVLADEATMLCHGKEAALQARQSAEATFEQGKLGSDLPRFSVKSMETGLLAALVYCGLCESNSAARRAVTGGGIRINDQIASDPARMLGRQDSNQAGEIKLSFGKKRHSLLVIE